MEPTSHREKNRKMWNQMMKVKEYPDQNVSLIWDNKLIGNSEREGAREGYPTWSIQSETGDDVVCREHNLFLFRGC